MNLFLIISISVLLLEITFLCIRSIKGSTRKTGGATKRQVFVDTSAIMDGRIVSVAKTGFVGDKLLITRSVIRELQLLADGSDAEKRSRARFGLDVVSELQNLDDVEVEIYADELGRVKVDERLMQLAKEQGGMIMTNDYNLVKVAATEQIQAININDLAQCLRSEYLPGDKLSVKIISVGSNAHQGVAYLPDGTMVVVDGAERYAGKNDRIEIEFERYLQTAAGRMMFAKMVKKASNKTTASTKNSKRKPSKTGRKRQ